MIINDGGHRRIIISPRTKQCQVKSFRLAFDNGVIGYNDTVSPQPTFILQYVTASLEVRTYFYPPVSASGAAALFDRVNEISYTDRTVGGYWFNSFVIGHELRVTYA